MHALMHLKIKKYALEYALKKLFYFIFLSNYKYRYIFIFIEPVLVKKKNLAEGLQLYTRLMRQYI